MDKTASENQCGKVFVLSPSHEVRMTSDGQAPNGYCGVSLFTPRKARNFTCDAICVTFKTASVSTCEVKVKFVGHKFRKEGDLQKVRSSLNLLNVNYCRCVSNDVIGPFILGLYISRGYEYAPKRCRTK